MELLKRRTDDDGREGFLAGGGAEGGGHVRRRGEGQGDCQARACEAWLLRWVAAAAASDQTISLNIPASSIGVTNESVNVFGFSTASEWSTDVALNAKNGNGDVLGSATITAAPFKSNRVTEYSGPLFSAGGSLNLSLNTSWEEAYNGVW